VGADFKSEGSYALEDGSMERAQHKRDAGEGRASSWLPTESCGRPAKVRRNVLYRVKTFRCVLELDNALLLESGKGPGLKHFQRPLLENGEVDLSNPAKWPRSNISSDQGPHIWSAVCWMEGPGRLNVHRANDPSHGVQDLLNYRCSCSGTLQKETRVSLLS
jgi:hypothetical protein